MRKAVFCLIVAAQLSAVGAASAQTPGRLLKNVDWEQRPSADQMMEITKRTAGPAQTSGWALLECTVTARGRLTACHVPIEAPDPGPMGRVALRLAPIFKLKTVTEDGEPVEGGRVRIPLVFAMPDQPTPPMSYAVGRPSYIVTPATDKKSAVTRILCPLGADKTTVCEAREIYWSDVPTIEESGPIILAAQQTTGVSTLFCQLTVAGRFENCQMDGENNPRILAAVSKTLPKLKSPKRLWSEEPVAPATVAIVYDWAMLTKGAKALTVPAQPEPAKTP